MKIQISYFISHPIQYFSPLFKAMSSEFDLTVYYLSDTSIKGNVDIGFGHSVEWDIPLFEGYKYKFLRNISWRKSLSNRFFDIINPGIFRTLISDRSNVVIVNGWSYCSILCVIFTAKILGKKVWMRAENPYNQEAKKPTVIKILKKIIFRYILFKLIDRFLFIGTNNKQFYLHYGIDPKRLIYAPYCVNNVFFSGQRELLKDQRSQIKKEFQFNEENLTILYVGKYISIKRPIDLLLAYAKLEGLPVSLCMVGEGELRNDMQAFIEKHQLKNVELTGFVNQSEISKYYSIADIFVLSSESETWGLVVNEAMLFGLPIIVTETTGCAVDLVKHGLNGFIYKKGDIVQLSEYLNKLITDKGLRLRAGLESRRIIEGYTYDVAVENMKVELDKRPPRQPT
ncbi:MAG: glycosyltransferase family 4 protein [Bacteroidetes bacterium]|nr:glycosyltransferase family 4 protein [Bacteroidota bacterium]